MPKTMPSTTISEETALQLCAEIRREHGGKWYSLAGLQCWGCLKYSGGDPAKMCGYDGAAFRGCNQVVARYHRTMSRQGGAA